ncbi:DgyrCDS7227 [Dimorphilus gyrociliatus]|nr:DgyrCDS7227 [Dimorphilus gyrociliatus]
MKKMQEMKANWKQLGHGEYSELAEEKEFFEVGKQSKNAVCHFYRDSAERCKIVDKHLRILAAKHLECRFVKINAEKAPFLAERLKIRVIPTLCLIKDSKTKDYIVGFDDLGGRDDFSTEMMEWRIAQAQVINYSGDLLTPPDQPKKSTKIIGVSKKGKTIRGGDDDDDSSDDDY